MCPTPGSKHTVSMLTTKRSGLIALLRDAVLPMGLFYLLRAFDVDALWALVISGVSPVLRVGYVLARYRRIEPLSAFVLTVLAVNVAVSLISGDPRLLLVRSAWFGLLLGVWILGSLVFARQPFIFAVAKRLFPDRAEAMELGWAADPKPWTTVTLWWGLGNLLLSGVVVTMAYTLPVDVVPVLDTMITIASIVVGVKLTRMWLTAGINQTVDA